MTSHFNKGPSYGFSAEVRNKILQKYDPVKEQELQAWIEEMTGCTIAPNFQMGLRNGVILCKLINKLQPGSVKKTNESNLNWHQLENITNFIKSIQQYGLKPHDIFEANDLYDNTNMTQVQTTLLALASMAKTKGIHTTVDVGVKYADKQQRCFSDEKMKAGQCVIGLQMGTNKCASQAGMTAYGTRRHLYDPKTKTDSPIDHASISLQMGTNKLASQAGMTAPGTRRHIYDHKLGTDHCDESTIPLQTGPTAQADVSKGIVYGLGRQIYDPKYCTSSKIAVGSRDDATVGDGGSNGYCSDGYRADCYNADCLQDDDNDESGFN
uniref:calponin-2-like n=1 Tax=Myxine glutinosa TaxID=7769 RepID=UPI00359023FC